MTIHRQRKRAHRVVANRARGAALGATLLALTTSGCAAAEVGQAPSVLPDHMGVDYQLGGAAVLPEGVGVVVRDSDDAPADDAFSICYLNAFQSQPSELDALLADDSPALLLSDGAPVMDPDWPDEAVFDTSSEAGRAAIAALRIPVIEGCAEHGFDAVEFDNLDTFTRFAGLDAAGTIAVATELTTAAHNAGLLVAQKNTVELLGSRDDIGFDFQIVEECIATEECDPYADTYGGDVIDVEYELSDAEFESSCRDAPNPRLTILRDRELVPAGEPGYRYLACRES